MLALTVAFFTAALALTGKIVSDRWALHQQTCGIAAALAGEIDGIIKDIPDKLAKNFRWLAEVDPERRSKVLLAAPKVSITHPVFDKVADKVGLLPIAEASSVSRIYSNLRSLGLNLSHISSATFTEIDHRMQTSLINAIAKSMEELHPLSQDLIARLTVIANQQFWHWPVRIKLAMPGGRG